jgi:hypothetical protein
MFIISLIITARTSNDFCRTWWQGKLFRKCFSENTQLFLKRKKKKKKFYFQKVDRWKRPRANGWILLYGGPAGSVSAKTESTPATLWPEASAAVGPYLVSRKFSKKLVLSAVHSSRCIIHLRAALKWFARKQHIHHQNDDDGDGDDVPINARKNVFLFFPPRRLEPTWIERKRNPVKQRKCQTSFSFTQQHRRCLWWMMTVVRVIKKTGTTGSKLY